MPIGWYIVPYKRDARMPVHMPTRYPEIGDYTQDIYAWGGQWAETEVLGNRCIVKVRAPAAVLAVLDGVFKRLPKNRLDDSLADLPVGVKQAIRDELSDMGYEVSEILERFPGDLGDYTLRDVLRFMTKRRLKPRWDSISDEIILDGEPQPCRSIESVNAEVLG